MTKPTTNPKLRFNCFLLREGLDSYEGALRFQYRPGNNSGMTRLADSPKAPKGSVAFLRDNSESIPTWAKLLAPTFSELQNVHNLSNRLVIFLPVGERTFALCFGYGSSTLEWSWIEANFGLRFAARKFNSRAMSGISSRRVDASARSQWIQIPAESSISDFEVELDGEFTRKLVGRLEAGLEFPEIGAVVATDSVSFKLDTDLSKVRDVLAMMLETAETGEAIKDLEFIDSLEPLRAKSDVTVDLEKLLARELFPEYSQQSRRGSASELPISELTVHLLAFAPPDDVSIENVHEFAIYKNDQETSFEDMTLDSLRSALAELPGRLGVSGLSTIKIQARDSNGESASMAKPLKHWLIFEAGDEEKRYLLTLGKWYSLSEKYSERLDADLAQIQDVTSILKLRTWDDWGHRQNWEKHFNERATEKRRDLICLDRVKLKTDSGDEIEACDLLHSGGYLIHVKHYTGSQTLSHLFAQGFVSAQVIIADSVYRERFVAATRQIDMNFAGVAGAVPPKYVTYAIAFDGNQRLPEDLPTFSKVNLRNFSRRVKLIGSIPTLARIQMTFKPKSD